MSIRILHAADLHLDSPFEALPAGKAAQRRQEQRLLIARIAQAVKDNGVQLVLLSGDLLDTGSAYRETSMTLIDILGRIECPVFIAPGNHDYYSLNSPYAKLRWPDNVHIFSKPHVECITIPELNVRVWGAAFVEPRSGPLLRGFEVEKEENMIDIMCLHGDVGNDSSPYNPVTEEQISRSGMDYIGFGHIHKASGLRRAGDTFYAWPGCPEGRGFDETGNKSVYIADITENNCKLRGINIAMRKYEIMRIRIADGEEILTKMPEFTENDIYRIILTGRTQSPPDIALMMQQLEPRFFSLQIIDRTKMSRTVWDHSDENTLRGIFLKRLAKAYDEATTDQERELIERAARWGIAALENEEEVSPLED